MKLIRKSITLTFQIVIHLSDRKCRHLRPKHVDVHLEIMEIMQLYYKNWSHLRLLKQPCRAFLDWTQSGNFGNDPLRHKLWPGQRLKKSKENEAASQDAFPFSHAWNLFFSCIVSTRQDYTVALNITGLADYTYIHILYVCSNSQCSCRANIFKKKSWDKIKKICYNTIPILFINYVQRLSLRIHGNKSWRLSSSAFSAETIQRVVKFFMNVAEDQFLLTSRTCSWLQKNWHETAANLHDKISSLQKLPRCVETSNASVQCHISTPPSTANALLQNDHYDVTTELRKQILNLTEVVKQLTALKCLHHHEPGPASLPLLDDDSDFPTLDSEAVASLVSFNSSPTVQTYQETATSSKEPTES